MTRWGDIMIEDIVDEINDQLAWLGPTGKRMGHVVLPREMAQELVESVRELGLRAMSGEDREEEYRKDIERLQAALSNCRKLREAEATELEQLKAARADDQHRLFHYERIIAEGKPVQIEPELGLRKAEDELVDQAANMLDPREPVPRSIPRFDIPDPTA